MGMRSIGRDEKIELGAAGAGGGDHLFDQYGRPRDSLGTKT